MSGYELAEQLPAEPLCGKWMPRKQTYCARRANHDYDCASPESMEHARRRNAEWLRANGRRRYREDPENVRRQRLKHKFIRYGLTPEHFELLLERQGNACGMCRKPFGDQQPIFIDHDHGCCPDEKRSCGKCIRGLLCLYCNTTLGYIERNYAMARTYLDRPPVGWAASLKPAASERGAQHLATEVLPEPVPLGL